MAKITIIGLGLIGGSIGLGLRRWQASEEGRRSKASFEIIGYDTDLERAQLAVKLGAVGSISRDFGSAVRNADMVIVATPVLAMREVFAALGPVLGSGAVVTDTGSTKQQVLRWADELLPNTVHFVGGHPMAGATGSLEAARADLFDAASYPLCPTLSASEEAIEQVATLARMLGAKPLFIDPAEHDTAVAAVSHLPFLMSSSLVSVTTASDGWGEMGRLAAGGYRDMSRLAGGDPTMYRDICVSNRQAILTWLDRAVNDLYDLREIIAKTDPDQPNNPASSELLASLNETRDRFDQWRKSGRSDAQAALESDLGNITLGRTISQSLLGGLGRKRGQ